MGYGAFFGLTEGAIAAVLRRCGLGGGVAHVRLPEQGINNQTYLVTTGHGAEVVIKVRPGLAAGPKAPVAPDNPYWPAHVQALFGRYANGDLPTLQAVAGTVSEHGAVRVPKVFLIDETFEIVPAPYLVAERVEGSSFDWGGERHFSPEAARDLGRHLGRMHAHTARPTFGIFERGTEFAAGDWWPRFSESFRLLAGAVAAYSPEVAAARPGLEAALSRARATGAPESFALICLDQSPTHYLRAPGADGIGAMIDVEGHLWAPGAYELAMVDLWLGGDAERSSFRAGYEESLPYPDALMAEAGPAYRLTVLLNWALCCRALSGDEAGALGLEQAVVQSVAG